MIISDVVLHSSLQVNLKLSWLDGASETGIILSSVLVVGI